MRPVKRRQFVLYPLIGQWAFHKRDQVGLLLGGQSEWADNAMVYIRCVKIAATIVEIDDLFERRKSPVMHVRCMEFYISERRRSKTAIVCQIKRNAAATLVLRLWPHAYVVELMI